MTNSVKIKCMLFTKERITIRQWTKEKEAIICQSPS